MNFKQMSSSCIKPIAAPIWLLYYSFRISQFFLVETQSRETIPSFLNMSRCSIFTNIPTDSSINDFASRC